VGRRGKVCRGCGYCGFEVFVREGD
jgi:hypothetical protein